jgi:hypothetical protein
MATGIPMVIFVFLLVVVIGPNDVNSEPPIIVKNMSLVFENYDKVDGILSINTINSKYLPGQINVITGKILDEKGNPINAKIDFVFKGNDTEFSGSAFSKNGIYRLTDVSINKEGQYTVVARTTVNDQTLYAQTTFDVHSFHHTSLGKGIFITIIFTISLLILVSIQTKKKLRITSVEPYRFALLTLCSLIPIISLIGADVQLGPDSPIGLVIREIPSSLNQLDLADHNIANMTIRDALMTNSDKKFEWIIQVGGNVRDNYDSGIKIPVYVFVFGMLGGYIRFLHKSAKGWFVNRATIELKRLHIDDNKLHDALQRLATKADNPGFVYEEGTENAKNDKNVEFDKALIKRLVFNSSMEDVAFIFLSPIIAFVAFFFLVQGGIDPSKNMPTLALVSFGAGLITDEVITKLKVFATSAFAEKSENQ